VPRTRFIQPSAPVLRREPAVGRDWLHEVKHDGWRAQLHLSDGGVAIYSNRGTDLTERFREVADAVAKVPARSVIIDAELTACDHEGMPKFGALMARSKHGLCAWCFDIMEHDGEDLRPLPLVERRSILRDLLRSNRASTLRFSEEFLDPIALLSATEGMGLEGVVSKKRDQPYKSGENLGWIKVKTAAWREANRERYKLFEKGGGHAKA
jgi:bifunctional non-homologous end joining protein LigD